MTITIEEIKKKKRKTILMFGISSFVGSNLASYLKKYYRIVGTYYAHKIKMPDVLTLHCDILNRNSVQTLIYTFRPDIVIYAIGISSLAICDRQEKFANALNAVGLFNVATYTERYGCKLCLISSSFVFSGANQIYNENDGPDPLTIYGRTKASSEFFMQKSCLNYLMFRCCQLYGRGLHPRVLTQFELMEKKLLSGSALSCDSYIYTGFLDVHYLAQIMKMAFDTEVTNRLFQISSSDIATFYDFAKYYVSIFHGNSSALIKGRWNYHEVRAEFNENEVGHKRYFQLSNDNTESFFSISLPTIEESLLYTYSRFGGSPTGDKGKEGKGHLVKFI